MPDLSQPPDPLQPRQPENPPAEDYAGYPSLDELKRGYRNSGEEAKKWRRAAEEMMQQVQLLQQPRQQEQSPYDRLNAIGVDPAAVRQAIQAEVQNALAPIARGFTARSEVLQEQPDYGKVESDVAQFIGGDPSLNRKYNAMFQGDPAGAMEWAYLKYGENRRRSTPSQPGAPNPADVAQASLPSGRAGDSRGAGTDLRDEEKRQAAEYYRQTGDPRAYAKSRYRESIPDEFFQR